MRTTISSKGPFLMIDKSTKVKGKRKSLTENLAAPKRAQNSQKKAKGKPTVDKENMSPEMIVAPEKPSAVKRTVNDAKSKGVIHFGESSSDSQESRPYKYKYPINFHPPQIPTKEAWISTMSGSEEDEN
ncbi:hypothetical protein E4U13_006459 [Claviceps humidiphila]|uniref:Uncharacterized protein n=1 Tax=Claviceps humidiphila TaxID=1294629 RepID=A0A9P7PU39_9HYPO|nr:hypothetical protein E4U13_006459 [Claviceps humidiphila]